MSPDEYDTLVRTVVLVGYGLMWGFIGYLMGLDAGRRK